MQAILVGLSYPMMTYDYEESMNECSSLASACGITVIKTVTQKLENIRPSTFVGKGKLEEIKEQLEGIDVVVFDEELSPLQMKNIQDVLDIEVIDRTDLILQIFEKRAKTTEAKLQVKIAKYQYLLPRLAGMQEHLSGQQGGSNFRGSGEKQLELDRRLIYNQLHQAKLELEMIVKQRQTQRKKRKHTGIQTIALVGYTNSGKSTLFNQLYKNKEKQVEAKDMLFATLETATRKIKIDHHPCLLTDTVGFVDRLPHHLVQAFRSTLEEVQEADVLIHVIDSSNGHLDKQVETTKQVLETLGASNIPVIYAYNKIDRNLYGWYKEQQPSVHISAKTGQNLDELQKEIRTVLCKEYVVSLLHIPYSEGEVYARLHQECNILDEQFTEQGIRLSVEGHPRILGKYQKYHIVA